MLVADVEIRLGKWVNALSSATFDFILVDFEVFLALSYSLIAFVESIFLGLDFLFLIGFIEDGSVGLTFLQNTVFPFLCPFVTNILDKYVIFTEILKESG